MATLTDQETGDGILLLNLTPRKVLGGLTPFEAFTGRRVALIVLLSVWSQQADNLQCHLDEKAEKV